MVRILPAAHIGMKACAELDKAGNSAVHGDSAAVGVHYPCQELEGRALSAAVMTDETDRLALFHLKADALQHLVVLMLPPRDE